MYVSLGEPSLYSTVYVVPGGFKAVLVTGNDNVDGAHKPTVPPGLASPTEGLDPLKKLYVELDTHPFEPVTVKVMVLYPNPLYVWVVPSGNVEPV